MLITGSSRGIGRACALRWAAAGPVYIVLNHLDDHERALQTAQQIRQMGSECLIVEADVSSSTAVAQMLEQVSMIGSIDHLVLNAGISPKSAFLETEEQVFDRVHAVNLKGAWLVAQAATAQMTEGTITCIASSAFHKGMNDSVHYVPTKGGLVAMMRSLATTLAPHIRVNAVSPGMIATDMNPHLRDEDERNQAAIRIPLGRVGTAEDVANAVYFLASDQAQWITGIELVVDGGRLVSR